MDIKEAKSGKWIKRPTWSRLAAIRWNGTGWDDRRDNGEIRSNYYDPDDWEDWELEEMVECEYNPDFKLDDAEFSFHRYKDTRGRRVRLIAYERCGDSNECYIGLVHNSIFEAPEMFYKEDIVGYWED